MCQERHDHIHILKYHFDFESWKRNPFKVRCVWEHVVWRVPSVLGADCRRGDSVAGMRELAVGTCHGPTAYFPFMSLCFSPAPAHHILKDFESKHTAGKWNVVWHRSQLHSCTLWACPLGECTSHLWNTHDIFLRCGTSWTGHPQWCPWLFHPPLWRNSLPIPLEVDLRRWPFLLPQRTDVQWGKNAQIEVSSMLQVHRHQHNTVMSYSPTCPVLTSFC